MVDLRTAPESLNLPRRTLLAGSSARPGTGCLCQLGGLVPGDGRYGQEKEWGYPTRDDEFLSRVTTESFLRHKIEALHGILDDFLIPLIVQAELFNQVFLEDPVQERAAAQTTRSPRSLLHLKNRLESSDSIADEIDSPTASIAKHKGITNLDAMRIHSMQSVNGSGLRLGNDLQILAHASIEGAFPRLLLRLVTPDRRDSDDVFDGRALDDTGG